MIGRTEAFASALRRGDVAAARALLAAHPDLTVSIGEPLVARRLDADPAAVRMTVSVPPPVTAKLQASEDVREVLLRRTRPT